ncbi:MAG TPA: SagB/ThcOx family dehydrogenase [Candidatus Cloacimonadota bacterium]|nr:SagB/ThcOx family dehydrogenase [Candidatus Cloacimonadota bacterium]
MSQSGKGFITRIKSFSRYELIHFFNLVFIEQEDLGLHIIRKIKSLANEEQTLIIKLFSSLTDMTWMTEELDSISEPEITELEVTEKVIEEIFEVTLPKIIEKVKIQTENMRAKIIEDRHWLKSEEVPFFISDQMAGIDFPPVQKSLPENPVLIGLPEVSKHILKQNDLFECIKNRVSHRNFLKTDLSLDELSFLLWATQGVREVFNDRKQTRRMVPSGGSRHPFETYLAIQRVSSLKPGIYRYLPLTHELLFLYEVENLSAKLTQFAQNQNFSGESAVSFIWSAIPYRTEWRYGLLSKKDILLDCGHLCQNLYLACEAIGCGTCAVCAYKQKEFDHLLGLDGIDEFTVYMSPVGKV